MYMKRKAMKESIITDHLAGNAIEDYKPLHFDFPDKDELVVEKKTRLVNNVF